MYNCFKFVLIILFFSLSINLFGSSKKLKSEIRQKAIDQVTSELENQLSNKVGHSINIKDYLKAIDYFSHGQIQDGKKHTNEIVLKEMFGVVLGSKFSGVIGSAWEFDKWVWNSNIKWANDRNKSIFVNDFLKQRMNKWYEKKLFGNNKKIHKNFYKQLNTEFEIWCKERYSGIGSSLLYVEKKNYTYEQFRNSLWEILLHGVKEVSIKTKLKEASKKLKKLLIKKVVKCQHELSKKGFINKNNKVISALAEFRKIYPRWAKSRQPPSITLKVTANAVKVGNNKYKVACELWDVVSSGVNKGKLYKAGCSNWIMSLGEIKAALNTYKRQLGIK